jgi:hypothetical protein
MGGERTGSTLSRRFGESRKGVFHTYVRELISSGAAGSRLPIHGGPGARVLVAKPTESKTVLRCEDSDSPSPPAGAMPPCPVELGRRLRPASFTSLDERPMMSS